MDLALVMDEVAGRLRIIEGLRVFEYPPGALTPPAAVVTYPLDVTFDATYGRGMDRMTLPVVAVVGKATDRTARDALAAYCAGTGERSVKAVLESGAYTAFHTLRVVGIDFDVMTIAATDYLGATFSLDITGQGTR